MVHLGSFAAAKREATRSTEDQDTFDFCGERFTVVADMPGILQFQLGAAVTGVIGEEQGLGACWEALRHGCGEDGFKRFYRLAVDNAVTTEDIMRIVMALFEAQTGRPTQEEPNSSPGPTSTSPSSSTSSSTHPALAHLRPVSEVLAG
jgi:hypothetical protein